MFSNTSLNLPIMRHWIKTETFGFGLWMDGNSGYWIDTGPLGNGNKERFEIRQLPRAFQREPRFAQGFERSFRKFLRINRPLSVRMLSGWNCTPQIGSCLCFTPMISPSSVSAVISRQSGNVSR